MDETLMYIALITIILIQSGAVVLLAGLVGLFLFARWHKFAYRDDVEACKVQIDLNGRRIDAISGAAQSLKDRLERDRQNDKEGK